MAEPFRYEVMFAGRVQGVGFRATARQIAQRYPVVGYVRNRADGRVELIAEGAAESLDGFLDEIRATMGRYLRDVHIERCAASGSFANFEIRH